MVSGEEMASSSRNQGSLSGPNNGSQTNESIATIDSLLARPDPPVNHIRADVHPDEDLTRSVIGRRMQFASGEYRKWTDAITRVALGTVLMSKTRGVTIQEPARFPHLPKGSNCIRPHAWRAYLLGNGSPDFPMAYYRSRRFRDVRSLRRA